MKKILIPALLCLTLAAGCTCENTIRRRADVLVIGGTTSGTTAAIAAARQGVQTLVVEETPMLGGMLTAQGVCATDGNFDLPSGLWNEFRDHLRKRYGGIGALWTGWVSTTLFEPHVADSIFHTMAAAEPTLEVVHGYRLTGILRRGKRVTGAEFTDARGGRMLVRARITVDATDLGDALPLSGTSYRLGMDARADTGEELAPAEANDAVQDLTVVAILKDYGPGADRTIERPAGYDPAEFAGCYDLSSEGVRSADRMLEYGRMPGGKYMINWPKEGNDINLDMISHHFNPDETAAASFTLKGSDLKKAEGYIPACTLQKTVRGAAKITAEGAGMEHKSGVAADVLSLLRDAGAEVFAITTSETQISCCIDSKSLPAAEAALKKYYGIK